MIWTWLVVALAGTPDLYQQTYEQEAVGGYRSALATLDQLPAEEKATYVYALRRGWLLYLDGQLDASVEAYDQAIARAPAAIEPLLGKTLPLMAARRWSMVERVGQQVLARDPKNALARTRVAWAMYNLGRYAEAEPLYRGLVADWPGDVELAAGLGWTLLQLGRKDEARKLFDEVLRVTPRNASAAAGRVAVQ